MQPDVLAETTGYMKAIGWGLVPLLVYQAYRRFLQGTGRVQAVMWALVSANVVNVFFNAALISGKWGFPELGTAGAGWATAGATTYMAVFLGIDAHRVRRTAAWRSARVASRFHPRRAWTLMRLGVPASVQVTLEVLLFSVSAIWIARLEAAQIAAHQIALVLASVT